MSDKEPLTLFSRRNLAPVAWEPDTPRSFAPDPALHDRALFVRHHVREILKKAKTVASHRTKGKKLLERCEASGDTGAGDEARAEYLMADRAEVLLEQHILALIARTELR
jgi:hypothetical protein